MKVLVKDGKLIELNGGAIVPPQTQSQAKTVNLSMVSGKLKLTAEATEDNDAVDKAYVDAILPPFTVADNDKVLGVVNGALAWVAKA